MTTLLFALLGVVGLLALLSIVALAYMRAMVAKPLRYEVEGKAQALHRPDLVYKQVDGKDYRFDLYLPPDAGQTSRAPVVVLIQGETLSAAGSPRNWALFRDYGRALAVSGMGAVVADRRGSITFSRIEEGGADVTDLFRYLVEHAGDLNIDPTRMAVWTFSAGGPLLSPVLRLDLPGLRGGVCFYSLLNLQAFRKRISRRLSDETLRLFSPTQTLETHPPPPLYIAKAGRERMTEINDSIDDFVARARERGHDVKLVTHETGRHGFDGMDDVLRTREIIGEAIAFLSNRLEVKRK